MLSDADLLMSFQTSQRAAASAACGQLDDDDFPVKGDGATRRIDWATVRELAQKKLVTDAENGILELFTMLGAHGRFFSSPIRKQLLATLAVQQWPLFIQSVVSGNGGAKGNWAVAAEVGPDETISIKFLVCLDIPDEC